MINQLTFLTEKWRQINRRTFILFCFHIELLKYVKKNLLNNTSFIKYFSNNLFIYLFILFYYLYKKKFRTFFFNSKLHFFYSLVLKFYNNSYFQSCQFQVYPISAVKSNMLENYIIHTFGIRWCKEAEISNTLSNCISRVQFQTFAPPSFTLLDERLPQHIQFPFSIFKYTNVFSIDM